jgi:hypothetical protein
MVNKEFVVTGHLKETIGTQRQTYMLHRSFFVSSKEEAIEHFRSYFEPDLEIIKIFSVVDGNGNMV